MIYFSTNQMQIKFNSKMKSNYNLFFCSIRRALREISPRNVYLSDLHTSVIIPVMCFVRSFSIVTASFIETPDLLALSPPHTRPGELAPQPRRKPAPDTLIKPIRASSGLGWDRWGEVFLWGRGGWGEAAGGCCLGVLSSVVL